MSTIIQLRNDTSANWTSYNPVLAEGELGIELNTGKFKIGNGTTSWNGLPYFKSGNVDSVNGKTGVVVITIEDLTTEIQMDSLNSGANVTNIGQITTNKNAIGTLSSLTTTVKTDLVSATNEVNSTATTNAGNITTINSKIPSQATSENQLADKNFVNSSIATNTANFIGTFESVSALEAYSGTVTNNDYAFVVNQVITDNGNDWATFNDLDAYDKSLLTNMDYAWVVDGSKFDLYWFNIVEQEWQIDTADIPKEGVTLNYAYNRYKASVSGNIITWQYEYTLNNSSFTANQWAALNSGATTTNIGQITTNQNAIGTLSSLSTTTKTDLVSAVNEVNTTASGKISGVKVNETALIPDSNNEVNIPITGTGRLGVVQMEGNSGIIARSNGAILISAASDTQIAAKTITTKPIVPSTLDYATKIGITTNTITLTESEKKSARGWQGIVNAGDLIPDFDILTPIETHTFDVDTTDFYEIFTSSNAAGTFDNPTDAQFEVWCKITTTNSDGTTTNPRIYQELDCVFREFGSSTQVLYGVMRARPESVTAASTGIQYLRSVSPKAINSGKNWAIEVKPYNANSRKITVQVYKTGPNVTWNDTAIVTSYDSNHQNVYTSSPYNNPGYLFLGPIAGTISNATNATNAGYITGSLSKTLASSTLRNTGYNIRGNGLIFKVKGQALLADISYTDVPIDVDFGVCQSGATAASSSTSTYTYTNFYQKHQITLNSYVNFQEAYENGDLLYARFTLSNGNLYSDDICSKYPTAGHTWYCIGMATSSTAINFDNTGSHFLTYNDEGKLTHIDGRKISTRDIVTDMDSATITLANAEGGVDYHYGTITSLTVTANDTSADETNIYFTAGASISVSLPNTLKFIGSTPTFSANKQYVLSIANNILISGEVS